jgi:hypothetical protein
MHPLGECSGMIRATGRPSQAAPAPVLPPAAA